MIDYLSTNFLEILGTLIGMLYLYWEYKGDIKLWIASIIMPAISLYIYYSKGLYADFGINIYYLAVAMYGWILWQFGITGKKGVKHELRIIHTPRKAYLPLVAIAIVLWLAIAQILINFTDSNVPWLDSFTTALSIVGMWMLARKWIEQWWAWLLVDAVSTGLYIYKGLYYYAGLYCIYTIIIFFGYKKWEKMMKEAPQPPKGESFR